MQLRDANAVGAYSDMRDVMHDVTHDVSDGPGAANGQYYLRRMAWFVLRTCSM